MAAIRIPYASITPIYPATSHTKRIDPLFFDPGGWVLGSRRPSDILPGLVSRCKEFVGDSAGAGNGNAHSTTQTTQERGQDKLSTKN